MISTRHTLNNERIAEDQIVMFHALQKQIEEMRQKNIEDYQKKEEEVSLQTTK